MSSPCHTLSPHKCCLAKTKAPEEHMEEEWKLISEGELDPMLSDDENMAKMWKEEEAERKAEEEHKAWEAAVRTKEEAKKKEREEREAKEATEREEAAKRVVEAAEERADAERRALEERLWEAAGQSTPAWRASGIQDPCMRCHNKGTLCILGAAKGKTMACEGCHHTKVSCSWLKKTVGEMRKQKQVQRSEEMEEMEVIDVDEDKDEEQSHFAVLTHLAEEHQDALRALTMTLDMLSMDFCAFQCDSWNLGVSILRAMEAITDELQRLNDLKEEEMGKGKGKERAKKEGPRRRTEDNDGDTEMGGAGPSSLV
ncbi:hypothetical protein ID866_9439 [Astraeus odoratus]|nr:hypothetical protein ID866_9439 [Astraeus odoratus]